MTKKKPATKAAPAEPSRSTSKSLANPTITLSANELTALVAPVIPHAYRDGTLPVLNALLIRTAGPLVTAQATDRYRIAFQRIKPSVAPEGEPFEAVIPLHVLSRIRDTFKVTRRENPMFTLVLDGLRLRVESAGALDGMLGAVFTFELNLSVADFPSSIDRLMREAITAPAPDVALPVAFNARYLADFRIGHPHIETLRLSATGGNMSPYLIRIGNDFIGLLVPMRAEGHDDYNDEWLELLPRGTSEKGATS